MTKSPGTYAALSVNVSKPETVSYNGKSLQTSIFKKPISHPVLLTPTNLEGDGQADLERHGGTDKALCAYAFDHYPYWEAVIGKSLSFGAFGENLTLGGALEEHIHIGDTFRLGEAIVQVSQPRQPCYKLSLKHGVAELPLLMKENGFTGFYFRVVAPGRIAPGNRCEFNERERNSMSVREANEIMHGQSPSREQLLRLIQVKALSDNWRNRLQTKLEAMR